MTPVSRTALVSPDRIPGWTERFAAAHGALRCDQNDDGVLLTAADGATAVLRPPWPADGRPGRGATALERLASLAAQSRTVAVVLVRRGGYAVGLCRDGEVLVSKSGSRYIQSRTAAGGWSQQRFARRRANQADAMLEVVAGHAARILRPQPPEPGTGAGTRTETGIGTGIGAVAAKGTGTGSGTGQDSGPPPGTAEYLVLGGDRELSRLLLAEPRATFLSVLPQLRFLDVADPKTAVLKQAARNLRAVRIDVTDPPSRLR
ncbi:acVLRF1 family peptidyl-tRNA hydrolase [Paenarthrobacter sp. PH39-S1]|uniref:acVLRF1 family peptidyl-tRNA hydrolase n=1 Tax=Paenarthrobacter sp. PH39-S1 TaxID=3046204 RepID=UPI0024B9130A|nr:acVLRF1 family peptidyl-tRNA hydrolase [Paenarthrobacter sp. PH39-S1]MDJ0355504.1 acVLRF1 family peptidyl-tRNA hydrolase [Paenarthrobacter sp. PH39-S1]